MYLVLAVDPTLAAWGQAAAIIIGLFSLIFVIIAVALNIGLAFVFAWVRQKAELVHKLHPTVDNINETVQDAIQGTPDKDANVIVRSVVSVPAGVKFIDKRVDNVSDRVAKGIIEFRARTAQVVTVARAFVVPQRVKREIEVGGNGRSLNLSEQLAGVEKERRAAEVPVEAATSNGRAKPMAAVQLKDVPTR
jgi:uncharacterized protein YoxC